MSKARIVTLPISFTKLLYTIVELLPKLLLYLILLQRYQRYGNNAFCLTPEVYFEQIHYFLFLTSQHDQTVILSILSSILGLIQYPFTPLTERHLLLLQRLFHCFQDWVSKQWLRLTQQSWYCSIFIATVSSISLIIDSVINSSRKTQNIMTGDYQITS